MSKMRSVVVDKIASVTQACGLGHELRISAGHRLRGRRGHRGRDPDQQVDLQHAGTDQRPHGEGRRKGDIVVGALGQRKALFGYSGHVPAERSSPATSSRCSTSAASWASATRQHPDKGKPFDCRVLGVVLQFPYLGERIGVPGARRLPGARLRCAARCARRAGGRARRHLHGGRQDRRRRRDHSPHAPPRARRRRLQGHGRLAAPRHPRVRGCRRTPHHDLHRPRRRHDHRANRPGPDAHDADRDWPPASPMRSCSSSATGCSAPTASSAILRVRGHPQRADRRRAVGQRSGRRVGRREAAARALRDRALRRHGSRDRQPGRRARSSSSRWASRRSTRSATRRISAITSSPGSGSRTCASRGPPPNERRAIQHDRARRHRLCGRRTAAPARRPSAPGARRGPVRQPAGEPVADAFPHLQSAYPDLQFSGSTRSRTHRAPLRADGAVLGRAARRRRRPDRSAARHRRGRRHARRTCVDISADFRYASAAAYEAVYKHPHGAPARIARVHAARCPSTWRMRRRRTSRIRAASRPRRCWPRCRCSRWG